MRIKWNRIGSGIIDLSIGIMFLKIIIQLIAFTPLVYLFQLTIIAHPDNPNILIDLFKFYLLILLYTFIMIMYNYLSIKIFKTTFGKLILKAHLLDEKSTNQKLVYPTNKQIFKREYLKWIYGVSTFGIYFLYCLYKILINKKDKQIFLPHDKLSQTKIEIWY